MANPFARFIRPKSAPSELDPAEFDAEPLARSDAARPKQSERLSLDALLGTLALALLGYAYLALPPLLALYLLLDALGHLGDNLLFALLELPLALAAGVFTYFMQIGHGPSLREPELLETQAEELFSLLHSYHEEFHLPLPLRILLTDRYEVTLRPRPRLLPPVWFEYDLHIGMPLIQLLGPEQFRSLLLREFGHLDWRHALLSWLYLLRDVWPQYATQQSGHPPLRHHLLHHFFAWYAPFYQAHSQQVSRAAQRAADRRSLRFISDLDLVEALSAQVVGENYLHRRYWPRYLALANKYPRPPFLPFSHLEAHAHMELAPHAVERWLKRAFQAPLEPQNPIPPLRLRLFDIGHIHLLPTVELPRHCAAQHYLGGQREQIISTVDQLWLVRHQELWQRLHHKGQAEQAELRKLATLASPSVDEGWRLATLLERHAGLEKAVPVYKRLLKQAPEDARLFYNVGRILYAAKEKETVQVLERAMLLDKRYADAAAQLISRFKAAQRQPKLDDF